MADGNLSGHHYCHRSSWHSIVHVLSLIWGLSRPKPHLFESLGHIETPISQSYCPSSHISFLAYPWPVGNIKTPHFLLLIQSHIGHRQTQVCLKEGNGFSGCLWCLGSTQTSPWSQREVLALHGWGSSGASILEALLLAHCLITLD